MYWLPYFRQLGINVRRCASPFTFTACVDPSKVPVILVGNKIDLRGGEVTNKSLEDEIKPIMADFKVLTHFISVFVFRLPRRMVHRK